MFIDSCKQNYDNKFSKFAYVYCKYIIVIRKKIQKTKVVITKI